MLALLIGGHVVDQVLDWTWAQLLVTILFNVWVFGVAADRYYFYTTGNYKDFDKVRASVMTSQSFFAGVVDDGITREPFGSLKAV